MRPMTPRDPAPSRLAYRLHRLWLTPSFWRALKYGLPGGAVAVGMAVWLGETERRQALADRLIDLRRQIEERPEFMVSSLSVEGASGPVAAAVREAAGLRLPVTSFDLDLGALQARIAAVDAVASARVVVRSGGVLAVSVEERVPALVHRTEEGLQLLDATGHRVAALAARADRPDLPLVVGDGAEDRAAEALALVEAAQPLAVSFLGLVRVGERRWDLVLSGERRILLPEADPVSALNHVIALDAAQDLLARDIALVDMRNPRRPTLRLGAAAGDEVRGIPSSAGGSTRL